MNMRVVGNYFPCAVAFMVLAMGSQQDAFGVSLPDITSNVKFEPPSIATNSFGWAIDSVNGKTLVGTGRHAYIYDTASKQELLRLDGGASGFGRAVAITDDYALVGNNSAQSAYVFNAHTGKRIRTFIDPNAPPTFGFGFGGHVALDGDIALIGDTSDDARGSDAGAAYVYRISTGQLVRTLYPPSPFGIVQYGSGVDIKGDVMVVGARGASGGPNAGAAYVYSVSTGNLLHTLYPTQSSGDFGTEVAISGNRVMVGQTVGNHGAAYLFDLGTGELLRKFVSPNPENDEAFGFSIDFDGSRAIIGSFEEYHNGKNSVGAAYLYDVDTGALLSSWVPSELGAGGEDFGFGVALDGNFILASTAGDSSHPGSVYVTAIPEPSPLFLSCVAFAGVIIAIGRRPPAPGRNSRDAS